MTSGPDDLDGYVAGATRDPAFAEAYGATSIRCLPFPLAVLCWLDNWSHGRRGEGRRRSCAGRTTGHCTAGAGSGGARD